jgi:hypothetical protein
VKVRVPPFQSKPGVIIWGDRVFLISEDMGQMQFIEEFSVIVTDVIKD